MDENKTVQEASYKDVMEEVTAQMVFDKTLFHLRKQGVASVNEAGTKCMYRGRNNTACAAGCHIKDKEYFNTMENHGVFRLVNSKILPERLFKHAQLLNSLQCTHDAWMPTYKENNDEYYQQMSNWDKRMKVIAEKNNLTYSP